MKGQIKLYDKRIKYFDGYVYLYDEPDRFMNVSNRIGLSKTYVEEFEFWDFSRYGDNKTHKIRYFLGIF